MFITKSILKYSQQDKYDEGCEGNVFFNDINIVLKAKNKSDVFVQIAAFLDVDVSDVIVDEDNPSILYVSRLEDEMGEGFSEQDLARWKNAEIKAYAADYYFEFVETIPATFI